MDNENTSTVKQRSYFQMLTFRFNERYLEYFGVEWDFKCRYEDIAEPSQYKRTKTSDRPVTFAFVFLIAVGLALLSRDHGPHYGLEGWNRLVNGLVIFIGVIIAVCVPFYLVTHKEYTIIPTKNGSLLIVRNKQHDAIVQKIQSARLIGLRLLAAPNPANSPNEELLKLKWLRGQGAITNEEYGQHCSQITAAA